MKIRKIICLKYLVCLLSVFLFSVETRALNSSDTFDFAEGVSFDFNLDNGGFTLVNITFASETSVSLSDKLLDAFVSAGYKDQLEVAKSIAPDAGATMEAGRTMSSQFTSTLNNRMSQMRSETGVSSGDPIDIDDSVWFKHFGSSQDQDSVNGGEGYESGILGVALGYDYQINSSLLLGIAYGFSDADWDSTVRSLESNTKAHHLTLYGAYDFDKNEYGNYYFINSLIYYSMNDHRSRRSIENDNTAKANYSGSQFGSKFEVGYSFGRGSLNFTPIASFVYSSVETDSYKESGSENFNLSVGEQKKDSLTVAFGVNLSGSFSVNGAGGKLAGTWIPSFKVISSIDTNDDIVKTTVSFDNYSDLLIVEGSDYGNTSILTGVGLAFIGKNGMRLEGNYNYEHKRGFSGHSYDVTLKINF